jgi:hypothetical protein
MNVNESDFLDGVSRALQAPEALKGLEDLQALRTAASYSPPELARARSALLDAVEAVLRVKRKHGEAFEPLPGAAPAYTGHSPAADKLRAELQDKPWMLPGALEDLKVAALRGLQDRYKDEGLFSPTPAARKPPARFIPVDRLPRTYAEACNAFENVRFANNYCAPGPGYDAGAVAAMVNGDSFATVAEQDAQAAGPVEGFPDSFLQKPLTMEQERALIEAPFTLNEIQDAYSESVRGIIFNDTEALKRCEQLNPRLIEFVRAQFFQDIVNRKLLALPAALEPPTAPLREKPTLFESWQMPGGLQQFTPEQTQQAYAGIMQAEVYKDPFAARALLAELPRALVEAVRLEWFPGVPLSRLLPEGDGE